ncbi:MULTISPECIES: sulfite exporter TauE/SafE family protein [Cobetia]|uniref:Probable membrane transporter protein n=1 Tax=Cobetia crustatorum TaxID=553385 RepID=A0A558HUT8_9GAMM|nr:MULTISPECIES: TSUP family transporter [Cobetia]TVU72889.1 TSUP family transporter [Cobetia crustatorum]
MTSGVAELAAGLDVGSVLALIALGGVAGFINVLSAGGSMLTLPLLMFLGLPPGQANATNRVAIVLQSATATSTFLRAGAHNMGVAWRLALPAVVGAMLGAWMATRISAEAFESVLIVVMVVCSVLMLLPTPTLDTRELTKERITPTVLVAMFGIGIYGGFIQVGVGVLFIVVLYRLLRIDLTQVNVFKVFIVLMYTLPALAVFVFDGQVRWAFGLVLAIGNMSGAFLGARVNMSPAGARWVKWLTVVVIFIIVLRLLLT